MSRAVALPLLSRPVDLVGSTAGSAGAEGTGVGVSKAWMETSSPVSRLRTISAGACSSVADSARAVCVGTVGPDSVAPPVRASGAAAAASGAVVSIAALPGTATGAANGTAASTGPSVAAVDVTLTLSESTASKNLHLRDMVSLPSRPRCVCVCGSKPYTSSSSPVVERRVNEDAGDDAVDIS